MFQCIRVRPAGSASTASKRHSAAATEKGLDYCGRGGKVRRPCFLRS